MKTQLYILNIILKFLFTKSLGNLLIVKYCIHLLDGPNVNVALAMRWFSRINYYIIIIIICSLGTPLLR